MSELNIDNEELIKLERSGDKKLANQTDDILDELDDELDDEIPAHIREARLNEMKMKAREQLYIQQNKSDIYKEIKEEEFLNLTTKSKKCVVHFFHSDFKRCDIMHTHLQKLAVKYLDVKFCKINVEKAKFFVNKLNIQVLPAVLCFTDGILKHKIIGFDQLGDTDNFATKVLEKKFWSLKFISKPEGDDDSDEEVDDEGFKKKSSIIKKSENKSHYDSDSD